MAQPNKIENCDNCTRQFAVTEYGYYISAEDAGGEEQVWCQYCFENAWNSYDSAVAPVAEKQEKKQDQENIFNIINVITPIFNQPLNITNDIAVECETITNDSMVAAVVAAVAAAVAPITKKQEDDDDDDDDMDNEYSKYLKDSEPDYPEDNDSDDDGRYGSNFDGGYDSY